MRIGGQDFPPGQGPYIAGVVNLSPESPNQDAVVVDGDAAVMRARALAAGGARLIDIGGQSSHYAAAPVPVAVERARVLGGLAALRDAGFLVSVDTWDAGIVTAAAAAGAHLINDSDGFQDQAVIEAVAAAGLPVIIPFINGPNPRTTRPFDTRDPWTVMLPWFEAALERAARAGVRDIILDPGTGYAQPHLDTAAKEAFQRRVYPGLWRLRALGYPLLVALPRKQERATTVELARMIIAAGADFLRAHDPAIARAAMQHEGVAS